MRTFIEKILLFLVSLYLIEVILGGGGTIIKFGPLSLRMVLLVLCIIVSLFLVFDKRVLHFNVIIILLFFICTILLGSVIGFTNNAKMSFIVGDVKKLMGFLIVFPFSAILADYNNIEKFNNIILRYTKVLGFIFLLMLIVMNIVDFALIYVAYSNIGTDEIMFRGTRGFFYKGFLYLNIGLIFHILKFNKKGYINAIFFMVLILFTFTRGFLLSLLITAVLYVLLFTNIKTKIKIYISICFASPVLVYLLFQVLKMFDDRAGSDSMRIIQIKQVIERINISSIFWGHGLGIGVPIRPVSMEIAFLEIFHKQGFMGLLFYIVLFVVICYNYFVIKSKKHKEIYKPYLLSVIFIYFQSMTNAFINNTIGITFVVLAFVLGQMLIMRENRVEREVINNISNL